MKKAMKNFLSLILFPNFAVFYIIQTNNFNDLETFVVMITSQNRFVMVTFQKLFGVMVTSQNRYVMSLTFE